MMHQAGADPAVVVQGRIVNINLVNYTVDVSATFDRKRYFDIQVGSPYLHYSAGEGLTVMPEVGAQCMVCIPGDSSPPFVMAFVMPHELSQAGTADAPLGIRSHGNPAKNATDASYAGGRPLPKPGDVWLTGRDGNFIKLHRGGVLSIGASELAQRIYLPLGNVVTDISGTYEHFNTGGAVRWTIQEGPSEKNLPSEHLETYRIFANDKYADIKIARGKVFNPMAEPDGGALMKQAGIGVGDDNPIIYEISVSPKGFVVETGDAQPSASKASVFRFVFDRKGNTLLRIEGNLAIHVTKKVMLDLSDEVSINGQKTFSMTMKEGVDLDGGAYTHIKGKVVLLGPGKQGVGRLGDAVSSFVQMMPCIFTPTAPIPVVTPSGPGTIASGTPLVGTLTIGAPGAPLPIGGYIATAEYTVKA